MISVGDQVDQGRVDGLVWIKLSIDVECGLGRETRL